MAFINDFMSLIYPRHCEACEGNLLRHEHYLCGDCLLNLPKSVYHPRICFELENTFSGRVPALNTLSLYVYQKCGRVQTLLHAIKYEGQKELGEFVGRLYGEELRLKGQLADVDLVVPVPLHEKKLRLRGYNQSEWFARGLGEALGKPSDSSLLERLKETQTQTKKKKYQRWENVEGIFKTRFVERARGQHILLVDDVITTGATLEAAWLALKDIEGVRVSIASIAFAGNSL